MPMRVDDVIELKTQSLPTEFWIELTSKCPFDCVFCSRALLRGGGEHLDFPLYESLVSQMRSPQVIRLNYSGESLHYPRIAEAIALAKRTGARVELVTALASAKPAAMEAMVEAELDRLTVSIHALSEPAYRDIYGHSTVQKLLQNLKMLQEMKRSHGTAYPRIDFAFVAMERNIGELPSVVALAEQLGVDRIDIHPVIRRDDIQESFADELESGRMSSTFRERLAARIGDLQARFPGVRLAVSSREVDGDAALAHHPAHFPAPLPVGAKIFSCEQNPWSTVHVLANGDLVACEVQDRLPLGNLNRSSLHEIWNGDAYTGFRRRYSDGLDEKCRHCIYKVAYASDAPLTAKSYLDPVACQHQLMSGWHPAETGQVWSSSREARALLALPKGARQVSISGLLPPCAKTKSNRLEIEVAGVCRTIVNDGEANLPFSLDVLVPWSQGSLAVVNFRVGSVFVPGASGCGDDVRQLGFLLWKMACA